MYPDDVALCKTGKFWEHKILFPDPIALKRKNPNIPIYSVGRLFSLVHHKLKEPL
jgi:hypothetical protein